jgi:hypothetical protein
LEEKPYP